jgi:D-lactate dehydrogenase
MRSSLLGDALASLVSRERVLTRPIDLVAYASDASFYRLVPQAVVLAASIDEVSALFRFSHQHRIPLTFRAAGTSLSGQALSDGILVEVARHWRTVKVVDQGRRVLVGPGVIGGFVNQVLRLPARRSALTRPDHRVRDGRDPANNSSGMCCGLPERVSHARVAHLRPVRNRIDLPLRRRAVPQGRCSPPGLPVGRPSVGSAPASESARANGQTPATR